MDEQELPIDIHLPKLLDWLVSRRHINKDWSSVIQSVREKINAAIQDMPEHPEVTHLLTGTYINYFHCVRIVDILKETEKDTKNILGWYGSQRMKDWQEVLCMYQDNSVYLAEAAQLLTRCVSYELAGLRRLITKGSHQQQECDNKHKELSKGITEAHKKYLHMCKQLGIAGDNVKQELLDSLKSLPEEFELVAKETKPLKDACQLYKDFVVFTVPTITTTTHCLPLLTHVMEHGNTTTYEWVYGEAPFSVEEPTLVNPDLENQGGEEMDFGDECEVDLGDTEEGGGIDWGALADTEEPAEIDWGIGELDEGGVLGIEMEESGVAGGVAQGDEALTVLLNPRTRSQFIDELHELIGFLKQRAMEMEAEEKSSVFCLSQFSSAPASVQSHSVESVRGMEEQVCSVLARLNTVRMQHLLLISCSPRYVDRLAESLKAKLAVCSKLTALQKAEKERKAGIVAEQKRLAPQLALMARRAKELQTNIEREISSRYKGRKVNIMGVNLSTNIC